MTRLNPDLDRLGDALRASTTVDLAREERAARSSETDRARHADDGIPTRARRPRRRLLAGSTLGLAGVSAGLLLALGGTAAAPAFAVTREANGSVLVTVNTDQTTEPWALGADEKLASMGIDEAIDGIATAPGPATVSGPVSCTPGSGAAIATSTGYAPAPGTPTGPPVNVLLDKDGTGVIPSGSTGAGTVHLTSCVYYTAPNGSGSGNAGSAG